MKLAICLTPAALIACFLSPILWEHGSSSAFDLAVGLPIAFAVAGFIGWANWTAHRP